ncbi:erythromycin esterase family protein [Nakamurella silvestris]|nr:erythromycin esterase family protein [Nakamurella silvestris]
MTTTSFREWSRPLDDPAALGRVLDGLLAGRGQQPALLALGEPTHGIAAFPLLRNDFLAHLVTRGYRSVALESNWFAAPLVNDYIGGADAEIDEVLAGGFSHGFGSVPGNREIVEWLRTFNAGRPPHDRIRFYGFDAPLEYAGAPSPQRFLSGVFEHLPAVLRPEVAGRIDDLAGDDADWTNEAAMFDPTVSIGLSERARTLRVVADGLADALRRAAPELEPKDPDGFADACVQVRTAQGLLRYHAAMATPGESRIGNLLQVRAEMMAENLLDIVAREQARGPSLVFAHNLHLLRGRSATAVHGAEIGGGSAGAIVADTLGERYLCVVTDAGPHSEAGSLQGLLSAVTDRRSLFDAAELRAALPESVGAGEPMVPGHLPLRPEDLDGADAVIFVGDTDGKRHQYW